MYYEYCFSYMIFYLHIMCIFLSNLIFYPLIMDIFFLFDSPLYVVCVFSYI